MEEYTVLLLEDNAGLFFNLCPTNRAEAMKSLFSGPNFAKPKLRGVAHGKTNQEAMENAKIEASRLGLKVRDLND